MNDFTLSLPLVTDVADPEPQATWQGFVPVSARDVPEPEAPQGEYAVAAPALPLPEFDEPATPRPVELLAPAGGPEAAFAAFQYGADAIYLGLKKFSARAEAENFTLEEVDEVTAYAHSLEPRRRVFATINTLIRQDELPELVETLAALADMAVNAVIVQDLGVYHLIRNHFPQLELHASTQLAVHNRAGAEALHQLGFQRVVLARELTFEEVRDITAAAGIETEVFIHGALCYSYSGLCLFSSQTLGRSGNRGKCAYSCRDSYDVAGAPETLRDGTAVRRSPVEGFPFSMKDLALPDFLPALRAAGVSCFKVEGRKKSPLYVATTTDYYRRLLDNRLPAGERAEHEADMQSVFSRPWTRLFVQSHKDKEVADRDTVGHRGTFIGRVESSVPAGTARSRLRFRTNRALELHDGLQIDLPILGKPFGFAVERLWLAGRDVFEAPAGSRVEVDLPRDHPALPIGAPIYCSSSQSVKNHYRHARPKPGLHRVRYDFDVDIALSDNELLIVGRSRGVEARKRISGPFPLAKDVQAMAGAARGAFEKLGDTCFLLHSFSFHNPERLFVPVSKLNQARRELTAELETGIQKQRAAQISRVFDEVCRGPDSGRLRSRLASEFRWSIKVDQCGFLDALPQEEWNDVDEVIIDIARDQAATILATLERLEQAIGRERIRLALPALTRKWEEHGLELKLAKLRSAGWNRWEAANLSAWSCLGLDPASRETGDLDLATDWSVYCINRLAARQLLDMGVTRFALSPEDGLENMRPLLAEFGPRAVVIVYQDTPQFIAESCAYANLIGGCPGKANCRFESMEMVSSHGEKVTALDYHCRTIVLNQSPFCLSTRLKELAQAGAVSLRADFVYRKYEPGDIQRIWRSIRAGKAIAFAHAANFDRGIL